MTSQPQRDREPSGQRQETAARMLRVVRVNHVAELHEVQERDDRIARLAVDCGNLEFCWQTSDHECHFRIYFRFADDAEVIAVRLEQFDFRLPNLKERIQWEDRFTAELALENETWHELMSFIYS